MSRCLDAAIAEALGYEVQAKHRGHELIYLTPDKNWTDGGCIECGYTGIDCGYTGYVGNEDGNEVPYFSESGTAMLELDAEMRARGWLLRLYAYTGYFSANFFGVTEDMTEILHNAKADALPEAVALAAYKALTGKEWSE